MNTSLTAEHIKTVIENLPTQHRIMIRLLLLQYLDISQQDVEYMAEDQPDSRFLSGGQPAQKIASLEGTGDITARANQYRLYFREKREKPWLQVKCLEKQMAVTIQTAAVAEELLTTRFGVESSVVESNKQQALSALPKPEIRQLEQAWDQGDLTEEVYRTKRLLIELQSLLRRAERQRRQLISTKREFQSSGSNPLQDHEIAHIWGIPLSSLASRKVKALQQFLTDLQKLAQDTSSPPASDTASSLLQTRDLWKETFFVLSNRQVERSVVSYGGLERSEEALMEKLEAFAQGDLSEDIEANFWQAITRLNDTEHGGTWSNYSRSIFALQRLSAIQADLDLTSEDIQQKLLALSTPKSLADALPAPESEEQPLELNEVSLGVLNALMGEQDDKRKG
ncbi:MAG: hypothetical protein GKS05_12650 [Nitrospirales bacterium]|nr:hypothetical protein [Nitrospirales bacterium]